MSLKNAGMAITKVAGKTGLKLRGASPEILIAIGIAGTVTAAVLACRATLKLEEVTEAHHEEVEDLKFHTEAEEKEETDKEYKKDLTMIYLRTAADLVKLYGPSVCLGIFSICCVAGSHGIMKKRNLGLMAAYKAVDEAFAMYRARVVEEHGEETDYLYKNNLNKVDIVETDEKGKTKKTKQYVERGPLSGNARWYEEYNPLTGEGSTEWSPDQLYNETVLRGREKYWNEILKIRGYVFLSEVYATLGFKMSTDSIVLGWVKDGEGDGYISFGMDKQKRPVNTRENSWLLDFNVDKKPIFDKVDKINKEKHTTVRAGEGIM